MHEKKYVFILNNQGKGAILARPGQFGYPPKIAVPDRAPNSEPTNKFYFNTGRIRYSNETPTGESMIYTEKNFSLNLDDFVGKPPEPEAPVVHDKPVRYGVTVSYKETAYVEVEAKSEEEAEEKAYQAVQAGEVEPQNGFDEPNYEFEVEELEDE